VKIHVRTLEGRFGKKLSEALPANRELGPFPGFPLLKQQNSLPHSLVHSGKAATANMLEDEGFLIGFEMNNHSQSMGIRSLKVNC